MAVNRIVRGDYIQGQFLPVEDGNGRVSSTDPGDLEKAPVVFEFSYEHVSEAVQAARRAYQQWRRLPESDRSAALARYQELFIKRSGELAQALSLELGKPIWDAENEIQETLASIGYFLKQGSQTSERVEINDATESAKGVVRYYSRGVMAVMTLTSLPILSAHANLIPALVNGNTAVINSSPQAPFCFQLLAEIVHDAGLPAGVVNILHGDWELGRRLIANAEIDGIFFTGPQEVAAKIQKQILNEPWKTLVIDVGGKNGIVVWDDCDYKRALHESLYAAFVTSGQRPTAADRILIHKSLFDRFTKDFHSLAKKVKVGYGLTTGKDAPFMGPLVSEEALEHYLRYQGIAVREGCEEIMRGKALEKDKRGYYASPSIHQVAKADPKSIYQRNEIFGPNVALYQVNDLDEAADILNLTQFGLVAAIYTKKAENYTALLEDVRMGAIHWNLPTTEVSFRLPYGGIKLSGNSRPMGSHAGYQCTYPVSSLEFKGNDGWLNCAAMPRLEGN